MLSNRVLAIGNSGGFVNRPTITTGVWNNFSAAMNYDTQPVAGFLNSNLFASIAFSDPSTDLTAAYWDNLSVVSSGGAGARDVGARLFRIGGGLLREGGGEGFAFGFVV